MNHNDEERKRKIIAAAVTTLVMGVVVIVCVSFGYMPPDPPIPEEGVEVNLGYSNQGYGPSEPQHNGGAAVQPQPNPAPTTQTQDLATQSSEESISMPTKQQNKPQETKPVEKETPKQQVEEKPKQPEINQNALFKKQGNKDTQQGGSQGNMPGTTGNMGKPDGNPNAEGYSGNGSGGRGGKGTGWSLVGRSVRSLPEPAYNSLSEGKIVITILVDQQGNVISAENSRGSTINDQSLVNRCIEAAKKAKFSASSTAAQKQKGTITYVFSRSN